MTPCSILPCHGAGDRDLLENSIAAGLWHPPPADALEQLVYPDSVLTEQRSARCRPGP